MAKDKKCPPPVDKRIYGQIENTPPSSNNIEKVKEVIYETKELIKHLIKI